MVIVVWCCIGIVCVGDGVDGSFYRCRVGLMRFLWGCVVCGAVLGSCIKEGVQATV